MSQQEQWGPWIEHGYARRPGVPAGTYIRSLIVTKRGGASYDEGFVNNLEDWRAVARYRIRKPRGLTILEERISEIDAPQREGVPA